MELSKEDERDVQMTPKDKDAINKFASHLARRNDLKAKISRKKKLIQVHEDAADELIIMDDEADVYYNVGDVFIMDSKPTIESNLERTKTDLSDEISQHETHLKSIEDDMQKLKVALYSKFGKTINLEE